MKHDLTPGVIFRGQSGCLYFYLCGVGTCTGYDDETRRVFYHNEVNLLPWAIREIVA